MTNYYPEIEKALGELGNKYIASPQEIRDAINKYEEEKAKKPLVINLFGAPGAGKSTGAAVVFAALKQAGVNAELATEFAKDKTWEHNATALGCQEYVFGKQSYRMARCRNDVDVIVTDSPLPLSLLYMQDPALLADGAFQKVVMNVFNTYNNMSYYIQRVKPYNPKGRNQTEAESDALNFPLIKLLDENNIEVKYVSGDRDGYQEIVDDVLEYLGITVRGFNCLKCSSYNFCKRTAAAGQKARCPAFGTIEAEFN